MHRTKLTRLQKPSCIYLDEGKAKVDSTRAFYLMDFFAKRSIVHEQLRKARQAAQDAVEPMIADMVEAFVPLREIEPAVAEVQRRTEKFEIDKEKESIRQGLMWESTVSKLQKAYQEAVDQAEKKKAAELKRLRVMFQNLQRVLTHAQSAAIIAAAEVEAIPVRGRETSATQSTDINTVSRYLQFQ